MANNNVNTDKSLEQKTDELKARLFPAIPDVIERGQYHEREVVTGRKDDIVAFHYFDGRVDVGGNVVQVGATVAEDSRGNLFYNINHDADVLWAKRKARLLSRLEAQGGEPLIEGRHEPGVEAPGGEPSAEGSPSVEYYLTESDENVNIIILPLRGAGRAACRPSKRFKRYSPGRKSGSFRAVPSPFRPVAGIPLL